MIRLSAYVSIRQHTSTYADVGVLWLQQHRWDPLLRLRICSIMYAFVYVCMRVRNFFLSLSLSLSLSCACLCVCVYVCVYVCVCV